MAFYCQMIDNLYFPPKNMWGNTQSYHFHCNSEKNISPTVFDIIQFHGKSKILMHIYNPPLVCV